MRRAPGPNPEIRIRGNVELTCVYTGPMRLPSKLPEAIERLTEAVPTQRLRLAAAALTDRYKTATQAAAIRSEDERLAYLLVRMPATYAALVQALRAAQRQFMPQSGNDPMSDNGVAMETMLDLGSGPGTAAWAAVELFPDVRQLRLVERDGGLIGLGRQLCATSDSPALRQAEWIHSDLNGKFAEGAFDLVVASYSLGELTAAQRSLCLRQAWQRTRKLLVLVEPGTRAGFGCIHQARSELIALGATVVAPCPHRLACPMAVAGDWCHFAARVERTAVHRRIKGGELGHEDEKFSYLAATPLKANPVEQRIVRHPVYHSGFVELQLCSADGIGKRTIGKSKKADYRAARRAAWGDSWPAQTTPEGHTEDS
jgi:ribosomal protein RSM22 (predicted rRNA methylase)